jgi:hypothetical protein
MIYDGLRRIPLIVNNDRKYSLISFDFNLIFRQNFLQVFDIHLLVHQYFLTNNIESPSNERHPFSTTYKKRFTGK